MEPMKPYPLPPSFKDLVTCRERLERAGFVPAVSYRRQFWMHQDGREATFEVLADRSVKLTVKESVA